MRTHEFTISCILPTRGQKRKPLLFKCLESFYSLASCPKLIEFIIVTDLDDQETRRDIEDYLIDLKQNVRLIVQNNDLSNFAHNYVNYACQCCNGSIIWGLNDEVECLTKWWDSILANNLDPKIPQYGLVDCNTRSRTHISILYNFGSSFPILTRAAADRLNGLLPKEIHMWGADRELYEIFKRDKRIMDLTEKIKIKNHSYHSLPEEYPQDELFDTGQFHSHNGSLTAEQIQFYVDRLACDTIYP